MNIFYSCVSDSYDDEINDGRIYVNPCDRFISPRMNAKLPKIMPHKFFKDVSYTVWADSSLEFKKDPYSLIEYFNYPKVGVFYHSRTSINQEIEACKLYPLDDIKRLEYHKDKPGRLAICGVIVRKNCDEVNILNESWWSEICRGSSRDQLSFPYTLGKIATYKNVEECGSVPWLDNEFWRYIPHNKPQLYK